MRYHVILYIYYPEAELEVISFGQPTQFSLMPVMATCAYMRSCYDKATPEMS